MSDVRIASRNIGYPPGSGINAFAAGDRVPLELVEVLGCEDAVYDPYPRHTTVTATSQTSEDTTD